MKKLRLSPSSLNIFLDCPRCFWLDKRKGIKRPRGIFPSLPGGMDIAIKQYFDDYRARGELPPKIRGRVSGKLFGDSELLKKWRSWRATNLSYRDPASHAVLTGALDDCLVDGAFYIPLDYKTRGFPLKHDPREYYQNQLDCYCLMLEASGYRTTGFAYLLFYYPKSVSEGGVVSFEVEPVKIETDVERPKQTVAEAVELIAGPLPAASPECEYCRRDELLKDTGGELFP